MTDRYISVKTLKNKLNYIFKTYGTSNVVRESVKEAINRLPSADVVEVVRCKDCKYNAENGGDCDRSYSYNCSCGERKEE